MVIHTMTRTHYAELTLNGLWKNNPAIVQLLGLCPLLAITNSVVNAIGMSIATMAVLLISNTLVSMIRGVVSNTIRLPVFVMIIAAAVTCVDLLMQAYTYELFLVLGIFLPLITTNCIILGRAEAYASKHSLLPAWYDGFIMGLGFSIVLVLLGAIREILGTGILLANMDMLFGAQANRWSINLFSTQSPFLLAILPPGAFIFMGLLIAAKNRIDTVIQTRQSASRAPTIAGLKRVRATGSIVSQ